jgi:hypothetical protein
MAYQDFGVFRRRTRALLEGRETFRVYVEQTRLVWENYARLIMRRWRLPYWVEAAEIENALYMGAWMSVWDFDPRRAGDDSDHALTRYVVWNAVCHAKRYAHALRGAHARDNDRVPGDPMFFCRPISSMTPAGVEHTADFAGILINEASEAPGVDDELDDRRASARREEDIRAACTDERERIVADALIQARGINGAVDILKMDERARRALRIKNDVQATRIVAEVAVALADRLDAVA